MGASRGYQSVGRLAVMGLVGLGWASPVEAQAFYERPSWYITVFGGTSAKILGTQDIRSNYGLAVGWAKPEPRFKWRHGPANLVLEGYYEHSVGEPARGRSERSFDALGFIAYARFRVVEKSYALYFDIGEGIQFATVESYDLDTKINSSPMIGAGIGIRQGGQETLVGLRILHLSNGGVRRPNRGQNQVLFTVSVRF